MIDLRPVIHTRTLGLMFWLTKRTVPSAKRKKQPEPCRLPKDCMAVPLIWALMLSIHHMVSLM